MSEKQAFDSAHFVGFCENNLKDEKSTKKKKIGGEACSNCSKLL